MFKFFKIYIIAIWLKNENINDINMKILKNEFHYVLLINVSLRSYYQI
jgi:hypothetical protein